MLPDVVVYVVELPFSLCTRTELPPVLRPVLVGSGLAPETLRLAADGSHRARYARWQRAPGAKPEGYGALHWLLGLELVLYWNWHCTTLIYPRQYPPP